MGIPTNPAPVAPATEATADLIAATADQATRLPPRITAAATATPAAATVSRLATASSLATAPDSEISLATARDTRTTTLTLTITPTRLSTSRTTAPTTTLITTMLTDTKTTTLTLTTTLAPASVVDILPLNSAPARDTATSAPSLPSVVVSATARNLRANPASIASTPSGEQLPRYKAIVHFCSKDWLLEKLKSIHSIQKK